MSVCHLVTLIILLLFTDDKVHLMKQNCCVLGQSREHEEDTRQHPGLYSRQPLCLGGVGGNVVKNVDQHQNSELVRFRLDTLLSLNSVRILLN